MSKLDSFIDLYHEDRKQNAERQGRIIQQLSDMEDRHICERAEQREKCKTQDTRISSIEKSQWLATGASGIIGIGIGAWVKKHLGL